MKLRSPFHAGGLWGPCGIAFTSSLLFDEAFTIHHTLHQNMEKGPTEGEGPDRFRIDGYLIIELRK